MAVEAHYFLFRVFKNRLFRERSTKSHDAFRNLKSVLVLLRIRVQYWQGCGEHRISYVKTEFTRVRVIQPS